MNVPSHVRMEVYNASLEGMPLREIKKWYGCSENEIQKIVLTENNKKIRMEIAREKRAMPTHGYDLQMIFENKIRGERRTKN